MKWGDFRLGNHAFSLIEKSVLTIEMEDEKKRAFRIGKKD